MKKYLSASLYSGAGFGDVGFRKAGFKHILLCEKESARADFAQVNFPEAESVATDVSQSTQEIIKKIKKKIEEEGEKELHLLYATPPCQGMSKNGIGTILKAMKDDKRPIIDNRNKLYLPFLKISKKVKPKWIFFENVCRLLKFNDIDEDGNVLPINEIIENFLRSNGYAGKIELVQMADYGLPQTRLRSVGIFRRNDDSVFKEDASFIPPKTIDSPEKRVTLREAISHLPKLDSASDETRICKKLPLHRVPKWRPELYKWMSHADEGKSAFDNNICPSCFFENIKQDLFCSKCDEQLPKPSKTPKNSDKPQLIKGFVSAYKRMYWDKPGSTVTTRLAYACSDHKCHPKENRVLSIHEAAILQGIDIDEIIWNDRDGKQYGDTLLRELIGECVPPKFGQITGEHIISIEESLMNDSSPVFFENAFKEASRQNLQL